MGANYRRTIVLGLDYSEFSGGIAECNRKMGLLDAEMRLAQEQAKGYGDETEKLRVKQEFLTQKIELQKKVVKQQAEEYNRAMGSAKKNEKQVDALDKALLNSRTTLQKLENEYKDNNRQLEELEKNTRDAGDAVKEAEKEHRSFGDKIRDVAEFIGVSANPAIETLAEKFDSIDERAGEAVLTVGTLITTLGGLTLKVAEQAKEITNTSQTMGMTTDQYQVWDYILKSVGYDAESASGDLAALAEKAKDAAEGGNDSAETFRMLGISVKDSQGHLKSQNKLFTELVGALMSMEDKTKRNAIASDLLSTTGEKLVPVLNMTKQEFQDLAKQAYETGNVMSEDTLNGFSDLNAAMTEFDGVTQGLASSFAVALLPMLTALFEAVSSIPTPVLQMIITIAGIVVTLVSVTKAIDSTVGTFSKFTDMLGGVDMKAAKTAGIIFGVVAALIALGAIISVIAGKGDDLNRTMDSVSSSVGKLNQNMQSQYQSGKSTSYHAKGTDYFEGGETWVGEEGPEKVILPRGSRILSNRESAGGGDAYYFNVTISAKDVKEFNDVVRMAKEEKVAYRTGRVRG
ncbi:MAG: hypothetical protein HFG74_08745 [Hungatella sp.]|jgi:phage-related minor tail protein|nr:hypothetical protein [Hungatella sp.]